MHNSVQSGSQRLNTSVTGFGKRSSFRSLTRGSRKNERDRVVGRKYQILSLFSPLAQRHTAAVQQQIQAKQHNLPHSSSSSRAIAAPEKAAAVVVAGRGKEEGEEVNFVSFALLPRAWDCNVFPLCLSLSSQSSCLLDLFSRFDRVCVPAPCERQA